MSLSLSLSVPGCSTTFPSLLPYHHSQRVGQQAGRVISAPPLLTWYFLDLEILGKPRELTDKSVGRTEESQELGFAGSRLQGVVRMQSCR